MKALFLAATALALLSAVLTASTPLNAAELVEFYRGARASGMGNAFTALADDADAVFYNPAGLALNRRIALNLLNPKFDASKDGVTSVGTVKKAAENLDSSTISEFFGKNLYAAASVFPSLTLPGLAIGYYYSGQLHIVSRNQAMPRIDARYLIDRGLVAGYGREFGGFSRRHFARAGVAVKWLQREGFEGVIPFNKIVTADSAFFKSLSAGPESGWGVDLGVQYEVPVSHASELILASAWHDIGDTRFGGASLAKRPPPIRNNLAAGLAYVHRVGRVAEQLADVKVAIEGRHLLEFEADPRLKMHLGTELRLGIVSVRAGLGQSSVSCGAGVDLGFLKIVAATYGIDNQSHAFMDRERRYMLQFDLNLDIGGKVFRTARDEDRRRRPRQYD